MPPPRFAAPLTDLDREWLDKMKITMAVELGRGMTTGVPPRGLIEMLLKIPEVGQAMELRARAVRDQGGAWRLP